MGGQRFEGTPSPSPYGFLTQMRPVWSLVFSGPVSLSVYRGLGAPTDWKACRNAVGSLEAPAFVTPHTALARVLTGSHGRAGSCPFHR